MCGRLTVDNSENICLVAKVLVGIQEFLKHRRPLIAFTQFITFKSNETVFTFVHTAGEHGWLVTSLKQTTQDKNLY